MVSSCTYIGEPSAPSLDIETRGDLNSLSFTIFPPAYAVSCVLHYVVTAIGYDNEHSTRLDFTVAANAEMTVNRNDFDMCRKRYNFTVGSLTRGGEGTRSGIIPLGIVDFIGKKKILNREFKHCMVDGLHACQVISILLFTLL